MIEVYAVVEGPCEQQFGETVLAPHFSSYGVSFRATRVGKPGHKGGIGRWQRARSDILCFLKQGRPQRSVYVTTMFDLYGMPGDWPGRDAAMKVPYQSKATTVEQALMSDVAAQFENLDIRRFISYVQLHELEALILSSPKTLTAEFPDRALEVGELARELADQDPESINDGPETAPSKRIVARIPEYAGRKVPAATNVLRAIGLSALRERCPHFDSWLRRIESIPLHMGSS